MVDEHGWQEALAFKAESMTGVSISKMAKGDKKPPEASAMIAQNR